MCIGVSPWKGRNVSQIPLGKPKEKNLIMYFDLMSINFTLGP
jgi:hypothetical protein